MAPEKAFRSYFIISVANTQTNKQTLLITKSGGRLGHLDTLADASRLFFMPLNGRSQSYRNQGSKQAL